MCKSSSLIFWKGLYNRRGSSNQLNLSGQVVCEYLRSTGFWNCFFHKGLLWYMILFTGNLPVKIKILSLLPKNCWKQKLDFSRSAPFHMKTRVCLKYFVHHCLWKHGFVSNLLQARSNFYFYNNIGNSKAFNTVFKIKHSKLTMFS